MSRNAVFRISLLFALCIIAWSCQGKVAEKPTGKLAVLTTLFPLYDFAKNVAADRAEISLLLPPGMEPHGFEPRPADILKLHSADVFIYTSPEMEPWSVNLLRGLQDRKIEIVNASLGLTSDEKRAAERHAHSDPAHKTDVDPHLWLDFSNAMRMVDNIRDGLIRKDPAGKDIYEKNAAAYNEKLKDLDNRYRAALTGCRIRCIISGGHSAFQSLAARYGLEYVSVYGFSPDAEPTPGSIARIARTLRQKGSRYLFYEELLDPRVARTIARETGVSLIRLHGAHNLTREEFDRGDTFIGIMNTNLDHLKTGLECP
ncbi:MAG TPA: zinc ABC transporter substrate-binding protein [Syntrophales bacterium]|nr:zinc ABC transporter substrate-binding protein [Syntrophales bacterium]